MFLSAHCHVLLALWGTVIECEGGWRSSLGYPAALFVPGVRRRRRRVGLAGAGSPVEDIAVGLTAIEEELQAAGADVAPGRAAPAAFEAFGSVAPA